ncbi:MAG: PD-(D/E)XK nuclease domain-containing protein, partial [Deltaproteobacteria bacterium]|nr:PD-(D/E)XK nuclease domain-containing protein [Deltaproteobacteria bacterium]
LKDTGENDDEGEPILEEAFTFRNPNQEVRALYKSSLFKGAFGLRNEYFGTFARNLRSALLEKDSEEMAETLRDLLYTIVHLHHKSDESFYHSMFQASFVAAGLEARSEEGGSRGDADMAIFLDGRVRVVIEVKYVKTEEKGGEGGDGDKERAARELASALDRAENAIREKHYAGSFRLSASERICLALAVRGRDEVAARFLAPDGADGPPSS